MRELSPVAVIAVMRRASRMVIFQLHRAAVLRTGAGAVVGVAVRELAAATGISVSAQPVEWEASSRSASGRICFA